LALGVPPAKLGTSASLFLSPNYENEDMSRVEIIKSEIKLLSPAELAELREWLLILEAKEWDRQFEADAESGRIEVLFGKMP